MPRPAHPRCHVHPLQTFAGNPGSLNSSRPSTTTPPTSKSSSASPTSAACRRSRRCKIDPRTVDLSLGSIRRGSAGWLARLQGAGALLARRRSRAREVLLSAPATAQVGGRTYAWQGWSDGERAFHTVLAGEEPPTRRSTPTTASRRAAGRGGGETAPPQPASAAPQTSLERPSRQADPQALGEVRLLGQPSPARRSAASSTSGPTSPATRPGSKDGLKPGAHAVKIAAVDAAGQRGPDAGDFRLEGAEAERPLGPIGEPRRATRRRAGCASWAAAGCRRGR